MINTLFQFLTYIDEFFWGYIAFGFIMFFGTYLTFKAGFFQIRGLPLFLKTFFQFLQPSPEKIRGIHPLKAFFASTGGMIGIGNVAGVVTAVQLGGPGALVWVWVAGVIGAIVKYCEIYLGFKFRVKNNEGGYDGGPMYFLKKAFGNGLIPLAVAFLFCIYGVEVYQFSVITDSISTNWSISRYLVIGVLLGLVLYVGLGGTRRLAQICSWVMPFFLTLYLIMGFWVIVQEASILPQVLMNVFKSAFTGHAAVGGFAGSSMIMAIQYGMARAAYSSDIGIGYDSIIQSESHTPYPEKQGHLAILGLLIDNLICTFSILIILLSGIWKSTDALEGSELIKIALGNYFPFMQFFIPFFFFVTGYTTVIAFFVTGIKCARFIAPKWGKSLYVIYAITSFISFSFLSQSQVMLIMSISGAMLLIINMLGIFRLRNELSFAEVQAPEISSLESAN